MHRPALLPLALLTACGGGKPSPPPATTPPTSTSSVSTTVPLVVAVDCASAAAGIAPTEGEGGTPVWGYTGRAWAGSWVHHASEGPRFAEGDGVVMAGIGLMGPSAVLAPDHMLCLSLGNETGHEVTLDAPGMARSVRRAVADGESGTWEAVAPSSPGVFLWSDDPLEGAGLAGLVVVRDPARVASVQPTFHLNFVIFEPDVPVTHDCDGCGTPTPAADGEPLLVVQRLVQVWRPDGVWHGGPPDEFLTTTLPSSPKVEAGAALWVNLFNQGATAHTLDLGALPLGAGGAAAGPIVLAPGEGLSLTGIVQEPGVYPIVCSDCPDAELASTTLVVELPEPEDTGVRGEPSGGSGYGTSYTAGGSGYGGSYTAGGSGR